MKGFFAFLWRFGIYVLLIFILYVVIIYKVKWENTTLEDKYLYFYKCGDNLCTTSENINSYLSMYKCDVSCPIVANILDEQSVVLQSNSSKFTYDYINGKVIDN